jgi:putative transcriptional regulator
MKPTRKLFNELMEGIEALQAQREGHLTLRTFTRDQFQEPTVTPELIQQTRELLRLSPTEFARQLRVTPKTLANWEQGRSYPNPQAATLILLVHKYPDTLERLGSLGGCQASIF